MDIIVFDELESTNDFLKDNFNIYSDKTVIRALKQTKGRGRFDSVWESKNDLTFSILFKNNYLHSLIAPIVINNVLLKYGFNSTIKWPNDILVNNSKVCGILIEKKFSDKSSVDIVGIGINIESRCDYNSLSTYKEIDKDVLLNDILNLYESYLSFDFNDLKKEYISKCNLFNTEVSYDNINYKVVDMLENGELVLKNDTNQIIVDINKIDYKTLLK